MSKIELFKCNNCGKTTEDYCNEIGWIAFDNIDNIHITGGRKKDLMADSFRYFSHTKRIDFCCLECFLNWLYLSKGHFNGNQIENETLEEKLERSEHKSQLIEITEKVKDIIKIEEVTNPKFNRIFNQEPNVSDNGFDSIYEAAMHPLIPKLGEYD